MMFDIRGAAMVSYRSGLAGIVFVLSVASVGKADFREDLARRLNADPYSFVLNLPPRPGGAPGSIYTSDMKYPIVYGAIQDPDLEWGPQFDMSATVSLDIGARAGVGIIGLFGVKAGAADAAAAAIKIEEARIVDLVLPRIRSRLEQLPPASLVPPGPVVVIRAYEGIPTLVLSKKAGVNSEAWAKFQQNLAMANASIQVASGDSLVVRSASRTVFAFEIARVVDLPKVVRLKPTPTFEWGRQVEAALAPPKAIGSKHRGLCIGNEDECGATSKPYPSASERIDRDYLSFYGFERVSGLGFSPRGMLSKRRDTNTKAK
jgi:hypothetical protein